MRVVLMFAALAILSAGGALAQTGTTQPGAASAAKPIDNGPKTPEANAAYQGGGVVLQGAPGAPPPQPQATPPGQAPQNLVPK